ncbi:hypothetical protein GCM10010191_16900 [Actinomadura vinacea]|uniref:HU family DNA-binding protein n=1 Tax=Actinomadura vinacea TaxID=115336 RepID=A0ABN3IM69_9ACTN
MNKSELIEAVAERTGSERAVARRHVDAVFDAIIDSVTAGERVLVTGFGTFDRHARPARTARNPRTGQAVEVAAGEVPTFRFGQTFRNRVAEGGEVAPAPAKAKAAEKSTAATAVEVEEPKPPKKAKNGKKDAAAGKKARKEAKVSTKDSAKKPGRKGGKKSGTGKKAAKTR